MPYAAQHADLLRMQDAGAESPSLRAAGVGIPGVYPLAMSAGNGPGFGRLVLDPSVPALRYRAPGSGTYGPPVTLVEGAPDDFLIVDGEDSSAWARVGISHAHLPATSAAGRVPLIDLFSNGLVGADVTAGEASAGDVASWAVALKNDGTFVASNVAVWLDASVSTWSISDDDATWVAPTSEAAALALPDVSPGNSATFYIRRTIAAATVADALRLGLIHYTFCGL